MLQQNELTVAVDDVRVLVLVLVLYGLREYNSARTDGTHRDAKGNRQPTSDTVDKWILLLLTKTSNSVQVRGPRSYCIDIDIDG